MDDEQGDEWPVIFYKNVELILCKIPLSPPVDEDCDGTVPVGYHFVIRDPLHFDYQVYQKKGIGLNIPESAPPFISGSALLSSLPSGSHSDEGASRYDSCRSESPEFCMGHHTIFIQRNEIEEDIVHLFKRMSPDALLLHASLDLEYALKKFAQWRKDSDPPRYSAAAATLCCLRFVFALCFKCATKSNQ